MKIIKLITLVLLSSNLAWAQKPTVLKRPKLIVGIVVDQMRYDYLFKYFNKYSETGFKRLLNEGFNFSNTFYNYVPTYTAPGHASIYTGTTPAVNGIISNEWYSRIRGKSMYCVGDTTVKPVGTTSISGKMSPKNLLSTTITDELRLHTNFKSKVIAIALKDRGAILPGGHTANAAYWHDPYLNKWISSTYYMDSLPQWVQVYNAMKRPDELLSTPWQTLLPITSYTESTTDDNRYESTYKNELRPVFPHRVDTLRNSDQELIRRTPAGNVYTKEFALAALKGEELGRSEGTDFLAISFSSPDYIGHQFGINSIEVEDNYLRLDKDLSDLIDHLNINYGKSNYLLFLTADHGAALNVDFCDDHDLPGGRYKAVVEDSLKKYLNLLHGDGNWVLDANSHQIYLNRSLASEKQVEICVLQNEVATYLLNFPEFAFAMTACELNKQILRDGLASFLQKGFNPQASGDVSIVLNPAWMEWGRPGTTHGAAYSYDTHVPWIMYGWNVNAGSTHSKVAIEDIAPTICNFLNIGYPSGTTGTSRLYEINK